MKRILIIILLILPFFPASAVQTSSILRVPFLSQAPLKIWDTLHEDACEEASLIMVKAYRSGKVWPNLAIADREMVGVVRLEEKLGYGPSITLADLAVVARKRYDIKATVKKFRGIEDIKKEIDRGKPVIIGVSGKDLKNPYFKNGGPIYHMLVIKGYNDKGFITNDPGTRRGEGYFYTYKNIADSIHDWNPKDIRKGEKNYLIIE